jgi:peptide/nickel transport system substrate-binding protein
MTVCRGTRAVGALALAAAALISTACADDEPEADAPPPTPAAAVPTAPDVVDSTSPARPPDTSATAETNNVAPTTAAPTTAGPTTQAPEEKEPVAGGHLNVLAPGVIPANFDPARNPLSRVGPGAGTQAEAMYAVYDVLVWVDYDSKEAIPRIAEAVESSDDASVWTIHLRDGVRFSDGTPYDAEAVRFNWERMLDESLGSRCRSTVAGMASIETPDPQTLVVTLSRPSAGFLWSLQGCLSGVASPAALDQFGEAYGTSPETTVGAGAFLLSDFLTSDHATFVRNPEFWDQPRPYVDGMTLRAPATAPQSLDALLAGDADAILVGPGTLGTDYERLRSAEGIRVWTYGPIDGALSFAFNTTRAPLDDVRVRKALVMAFDPHDFNEKIAGGELEMADTFLGEGSIFYNPDVSQPSDQFGEAQRLIDEYVAEHGGPIEITLTTSTSVAALNTVMQQQWSRLNGVNVAITNDTDATALPKLLGGDYQVAAFNLGSHVDPETLFNRYHSSSSANVLGYSDPQMDAWLEEYLGTIDTDRQKELVDEITKFLVMDQHWILQTYRGLTVVATRDDVHGLTWTNPQDFDPSTMWIDR